MEPAANAAHSSSVVHVDVHMPLGGAPLSSTVSFPVKQVKPGAAGSAHWLSFTQALPRLPTVGVLPPPPPPRPTLPPVLVPALPALPPLPPSTVPAPPLPRVKSSFPQLADEMPAITTRLAKHHVFAAFIRDPSLRLRARYGSRQVDAEAFPYRRPNARSKPAISRAIRGRRAARIAREISCEAGVSFFQRAGLIARVKTPRPLRRATRR